jgi:uncharacterized membrane protein
VSDMASRLERAIEATLTIGLAASASLLLAGMGLDSPSLLRAGIVLLVLTPVARVVAVTAGLLYARDWPFALLSLAVLTVIASSALVALGTGP